MTGEKAQTDAGNGERIAPKNVVVMYAQFTETGDRKHRLDADIVGIRQGAIAINGRTIDGTWKKDGGQGTHPVLRCQRRSQSSSRPARPSSRSSTSARRSRSSRAATRRPPPSPTPSG